MVRGSTSSHNQGCNKVIPKYECVETSSQSSPVVTTSSGNSKFSFIKQAWRNLLQFGTLSSQQPAAVQPETIGRVVVVGVHGWYTALKLVQTVFGEQEGTSSKLCQMMVTSVKRKLNQPCCETINCIELEGHGRVIDRVEMFERMVMESESYRMVLGQADLILFATHSQGVPVCISLLSRLLLSPDASSSPPIIRSETKVGVLCMAGIGHGPYTSLKGNLVVQYVETEAARELFEFCDADSKVSRQLRHDLKVILEHGVAVTAVASWRDQVVPIYSALLATIDHSLIQRAIFIDESYYRDDFLTRFIEFLIRIRNLGLSDYDLLGHLSPYISGSLYAGDTAHSTIYDELQVYDLAVEWTVKSKTIDASRSAVEPKFHDLKEYLRMLRNPYYIPWNIQRLFHSLATSNKQMQNELIDILSGYQEWMPIERTGRVLRYRMEPVTKSRL